MLHNDTFDLQYERSTAVKCCCSEKAADEINARRSHGKTVNWIGNGS